MQSTNTAQFLIEEQRKKNLISSNLRLLHKVNPKVCIAKKAGDLFGQRVAVALGEKHNVKRIVPYQTKFCAENHAQ
jgi:hypothetical protein